MNEEWERITRLFDAARSLNPAERSAFLESVCCGDAAARSELESLLANDRSDTFLATSPSASLMGALRESVSIPEPGQVLRNRYRLEARIATGGQAVVYRATDQLLSRPVVVKFLRIEGRHNEWLQSRLRQEREILARIEHPGVVGILDCGELSDGSPFLVIQYIEGQSLRDALRQGQLNRDRVAAILRETGSALSAAHALGISHRDLKPENVMLQQLQGGAETVKLIDFGIAKIERSPVTEGITTVMIAGTVRYMAPEQFEGNNAPASDIYSLALIVSEMLCGYPDPRALPATVRPTERRLLEAALAFRPEERPQDVGAWSKEFAQALVSADDRCSSPGVTEQTGRLSSRTGVVVIALLGVALAVSVIALWRGTRSIDHPLTQLTLGLKPAMVSESATVAISPDGRRLVYPAEGADGKQQLVMQLLEDAQAIPLPGTENGFDPVFSRDGQWIGFFADGQLKKISVRPGGPVVLCSARSPHGASWDENGNIVAALGQDAPLSLVPAAGGTPRPLTTLPTGEITHRWPQVLPGSQTVIFTASPTEVELENANIEAVSLRTGQISVLVRGAYYGRYLPTGHLLYVHQGTLFAVQFDPARLAVRGIPVPLLQDMTVTSNDGGSRLGFSEAGTFIYTTGTSRAQAWPVSLLDSSGGMVPVIPEPDAYTQLRFSPDGRKLAFSKHSDVHVYDLDRGVTTRLTFSGDARVPVWTPDGTHIVFHGANSLSWIRSDAGEAPKLLLRSQARSVPWSFSPDSSRLAYYEQAPETGQDIWILPLDSSNPDRPKPGKPELFLRTPADETHPVFSPDGRWIAYRSNEAGRNEIFVRPFPSGTEGKWQISVGGGVYAFWSKENHELFYETTDFRIMVVSYRVNGASFIPGKPRLWSNRQLFSPGLLNIDLAPDGKHFGVVAPDPTSSPKDAAQVTMLLNYFDEIRRRIKAANR